MESLSKKYCLASLLEETHYLVIPRLQRAYAQGRKAFDHLRPSFIGELFDALREEKELELNFVYGSLWQDRYELLDGQQRLTTLYLLHLYVYLRESGACPEWLRGRLCYETRRSTSDFLRQVEKLSEHFEKGESPSTYIWGQKWYTEAYRSDASVQGMLVMLDAIHKEYSKAPQPLAKRLHLLQFYSLPLENFHLTEELYMKMNARGLPLTSFENFKADLVGALQPKPTDGDDAFEAWLTFTSHLDNRWVDIFWEQGQGAGALSDRYLRFFFRSAAILQVVACPSERTNNRGKDTRFEFFDKKSEEQTADAKRPYFGFDRYRELFKDIEEHKLFGSAMTWLTKLLEALLGKEKDLWEIAFTTPWGTRLDKFFEDEKDYTQKQAIRYAGFLFYVLSHDAPSEEGEQREAYRKELKCWMNIVHRLAENSNVDNVQKRVQWIKRLYDIQQLEGNSYQKLLAYKLPDTDTDALREERHKAQLILEDPAFEEAFSIQDKHDFFRGFADVLLVDGITPDTFKKRAKKLAPLFDKEGIASDSEHLMIRALVAAKLEGNSYLNDVVLTEHRNDGLHLKKLLRSPSSRQLFASILEQDEPRSAMATYLQEQVYRLARGGKREQAYARLCGEPKLFDWVERREKEKRTIVLLRSDRSDTNEVYLHFYKMRYDYFYLANHRRLLIPQLLEEGWVYSDKEKEKQQEWHREAYGEYFGHWPLVLQKTVGGQLVELDLHRNDDLGLHYGAGEGQAPWVNLSSEVNFQELYGEALTKKQCQWLQEKLRSLEAAGTAETTPEVEPAD